jgi:hypothetical protein
MVLPSSDASDLRFANHASDSTRSAPDPVLRFVRGLGQHLHNHVGIGTSPPGIGLLGQLYGSQNVGPGSGTTQVRLASPLLRQCKHWNHGRGRDYALVA